MDNQITIGGNITSGVSPIINGESKDIAEDAVKQQKNTRIYGKPFVKGDPRINRKGAPKKVTIWDYLEDGEDEKKIRDFLEDPKFKDKVAEYILGKPKQPLVGGDENDNPIPIKIYGGESLSRHPSNEKDI